MTPFMQGRLAGKLGKGRCTNPYERGTEEYRQWLEGYSDGAMTLTHG